MPCRFSSVVCFCLALCTASVTTAASADRLAGVEHELARREYRASRTAVGLQAPNRAHGLRIWFEPQGIRVHDRTAADGPELLALSLSGVGRGGVLSGLGSGVVTSEGAHVELRRPGVVEWYENSAAGLEQGFTLTRRPDGRGPLVLELALRGASASARGNELVFETQAGRRLAYGRLVALDAAKRRLPARFALRTSQRVRIVVDDAAADYPLVIDPLLTGVPDTQLESTVEFGQFGRVAGAGDVNNDGYDDVIVGAFDVAMGQSEEGIAYVFLGAAAGIPSGTQATASGRLEGNQIGASLGSFVASAGDVNGDGYDDVIVGAPDYDAGQTNEGAAFVFLGSASGIGNGSPSSAAAQLETDQSNAQLSSVAGAGDVNGDGYDDVVIGARLYDAGQTNEGAAFVFLGSASGVADGNPANAAAQLESNQGSAFLGSVAGAGDVNDDGYADVIVGAPGYDSGQPNEGIVMVFLGSATGISDGNPSNASAVIESNSDFADFGSGVSGAGDVNADGFDDVIASAPGYSAGETHEGAAFVFHGSATGIASGNLGTSSAQIESDQADAELGGVSGAGDVNGDGYGDVIVGASRFDAGQPGSGVAFVFLGTPAGIPDGDSGTAAALLTVNQVAAGFGAVAQAGDVNGDGYDDVVVGAGGFGPVANKAYGAAFIFLGSAGLSAKVDSDGDGLSDDLEQALGSNPLSIDGDADTLGDAIEVWYYGTNPLSVDSDADGRSDPDEIAASTPPNLPLPPNPGASAPDGDGIEDFFDNCYLENNPEQKDFDHDGCGDVCDSDGNQDGVSSGAADFSAFKATFQKSEGHPAYNGAFDANCDGTVGSADFAVFKRNLSQPSGPSGFPATLRPPWCSGPN